MPDVDPSPILIFANPIAGRGRGRAIADALANQLDRGGTPFKLFDQSASGLSDDEITSSARAMVTIGGDGTLRGAVQRMLSLAKNDAARVPPVLVIPLGTANLMARHLKLKWNRDTQAQQAADALAAMKTVELDSAFAGDRLFLLMAGVGIDGAVVHELDRIRRGPISVASYATPLLKALTSYDFPPLTVEVDGRIVADGVPGLAFAGNVAEYGTGFPVLSEARSDDGVLDVCVLPCRRAPDVVRWAMLTSTGQHVRAAGVVYTKGKSVRITSASAAPVQIDGEPAGHTPLAIELHRSRLRFIVQ